MQEMAADKEKGSSEQQQQQDNGGAQQKTMVLPKKRPLAGQPAVGVTTAAVATSQQLVAGVAVPKKQAKASGDEVVDDETLIRETEAALKSLSGGWPGPRHSFYRTGHHDDDRYESPAFVNLFDEKKNGGGAHPPPPPPPLAIKLDENKNTCDSRPPPSQQQQQQPPQQQRRDLDNLLNKMDQQKDCGEHNKKADKYAPSKYEPDFNELVDDSSDELEIDMSADGSSNGAVGAGDKDDDEDGPTGGDRLRRKLDVDRRNNNSHVRADEMTGLKHESDSTSYDAYLMDKTTFSAFRPVSGGEPKDPARLDLPTAVGAAMSPLGPYPPAGATFVVGYTGPVGLAANAGSHGSPVSKLSPGGGGNMGGGGVVGSVCVPVTAVKPVCVKLEDDGGAVDCKPDGPVKMDAASPLSKQYTILQPAGADSRAATALQDVAREGVLGASVVSGTAAGSLSPRTAAGTPKLNVVDGAGQLMAPGCMKGGECDRGLSVVGTVPRAPAAESARNLALINIQGGLSSSLALLTSASLALAWASSAAAAAGSRWGGLRFKSTSLRRSRADLTPNTANGYKLLTLGPLFYIIT